MKITIEADPKEIAALVAELTTEQPRVVFEKTLPNGLKVVRCNTPKAVSMHIDGTLRGINIPISPIDSPVR